MLAPSSSLFKMRSTIPVLPQMDQRAKHPFLCPCTDGFTVSLPVLMWKALLSGTVRAGLPEAQGQSRFAFNPGQYQSSICFPWYIFFLISQKYTQNGHRMYFVRWNILLEHLIALINYDEWVLCEAEKAVYKKKKVWWVLLLLNRLQNKCPFPLTALGAVPRSTHRAFPSPSGNVERVFLLYRTYVVWWKKHL